MLFNSVEFAVFLPIVFLVFWTYAVRSQTSQNIFVTIVSYIFYGWWDPRFLLLIIVSTLVDYFVGLRLEMSESISRRRTLLWISIATNLSILGFFKYYNFFADSLVVALNAVGVDVGGRSLNILLPVGISFYTLQTLSYTIDVYRGRMAPTKDLAAFAAFVSFFPQLVAGPIERATHLLPQFTSVRKFSCDRGIDGLRQILWGMFTKVVIADNCAVCANAAFDSASGHTGIALIAGAVMFSLQVYCDFAGYSNIAIGTAKLFGFELMRNFAFPYFSRDIAEFWRRWHISLSTWFRDYVYIPLGGSRCSRLLSVRNVFVVFLLSGLWHGANWTFVIWGALNACYFLPLLLFKRNRANLDSVAAGRLFPSIRDAASILLTYSLTVLAWVFFRADSLIHAISYLERSVSGPFWKWPEILSVQTALLAVGFLLVEWIGREQDYALAGLVVKWPRPVRLATYYGLCLAIAGLAGAQQEFIYFQF